MHRMSYIRFQEIFHQYGFIKYIMFEVKSDPLGVKLLYTTNWGHQVFDHENAKINLQCSELSDIARTVLGIV